MKMTQTQAKDYINHHPEVWLEPAKKRGTYICPLCKNGSGKTGDGLALDPHDKTGTHYKCFRAGCDFYGDMVELIAKAHGIQDGGSAQAFQKAYEVYGIEIEADHAGQSRPEPKPKKEQPPATRQDMTEQYREWHTFLLQDKKALAYLESRGIRKETAQHFMFGYCPEWTHPTAERSYPSPRIIIPRTRYDYSARRIDGQDAAKYIVCGSQAALFNAKTVRAAVADGMPIVAVEGELDAAAVYQAGWEYVVGLGTANNWKRLVELVKDEAPGVTVILALDDDEAGHKAQEAAETAMKEAGLYLISAGTEALYDGHKDAAGAANADIKGFSARLMEYTRRGRDEQQQRKQQAEAEAYSRSGAGMVDFFLAVCKGDQYRPISTGVKCIDNALCGGLVRQTVVVLGAAPGQGKTALAAQIGENLARAGESVLYFNMEMSREQLLARSLSRIINAGGGMRMTTTDILHGYDWSVEQEEVVHSAADQYKAEVAGRFMYNPGDGNTTDLAVIMQRIQDEKARIGHPPIVFLDYLQLLTSQNSAGRDDDPAQTIRKAMQQLKTYAIDNNTIVFVIVANNRASMRSGTADLFSGRDTSSIEYGADVHLGLEYKALHDKDDQDDEDEDGEPAKKITVGKIRAIKQRYFKDPDNPQLMQDYKKYCCEMSLVVNKNRHGEPGRRAYLYFDGAIGAYTPLDEQEPARKVRHYDFPWKKPEQLELLP